MTKKIESALISVFYKDGLETVARQLHNLNVKLFSTGGTQKFIEQLGIPVTPVEELTTYPSILGGRVKTLHPAVFGGILGRRDNETDVKEMAEYHIPNIDLVIVDLYPFEETLSKSNKEEEIIEKIDIGGVSLIRAAAKNYKDVMVVASPEQYQEFENLLTENSGEFSQADRKRFASKAFAVCADYDIAIADYFTGNNELITIKNVPETPLRYGENPHQQAVFHGDYSKIFSQLHGKEISYNNLVDIDAAIQLISEFNQTTFAIIKHTNVCGIASRETIFDSWKAALAGDPESAFGGVLICNGVITKETAEAINEIFFEVLIAHQFDGQALQILTSKKNRILLQCRTAQTGIQKNYKSVLNGMLFQDTDKGNYNEWKEVGGRPVADSEKNDLVFANIICKHLKSNAIALVKDMQLIGKGCGQTSRIDSLRQALDKAGQFNFSTAGAVLASDAFFPFDDCVKMGHEAGITAFIQPGGSVRDKDSIEYCKENNLGMVLTGQRHFKH